MNDQQWDKLIEDLQKRFGDLEVVTEEIIGEHSGEMQVEGSREILEFETPMGLFRVVRESKPMVLGSKFHYSHRQGDAARTEYILSDSELSHKLIAYRMDPDGEWQKIDADVFAQ